MMNGNAKHCVFANVKPWIPVQSNLINIPHLIITVFVLASTQTVVDFIVCLFVLIHVLLLRSSQQLVNFLPLVLVLPPGPSLKILSPHGIQGFHTKWVEKTRDKVSFSLTDLENTKYWIHLFKARKCYVCRKSVWCWPCKSH